MKSKPVRNSDCNTIATQIARISNVLNLIEKIWRQIPIPAASAIVRYSGVESQEIVCAFGGKSFDELDFDCVIYPDFAFEASEVGLQYYTGGILRNICILLAECAPFAPESEPPPFMYTMFSWSYLDSILSSETAMQRLFSGALLPIEIMLTSIVQFLDLLLDLGLGDEIYNWKAKKGILESLSKN